MSVEKLLKAVISEAIQARNLQQKLLEQSQQKILKEFLEISSERSIWFYMFNSLLPYSYFTGSMFTGALRKQRIFTFSAVFEQSLWIIYSFINWSLRCCFSSTSLTKNTWCCCCCSIFVHPESIGRGRHQIVWFRWWQNFEGIKIRKVKEWRSFNRIKNSLFAYGQTS